MATTQKYITTKEYLNVDDTVSTKRVNTNPRYKHYCQVNYTAGDEEQFFLIILQRITENVKK